MIKQDEIKLNCKRFRIMEEFMNEFENGEIPETLLANQIAEKFDISAKMARYWKKTFIYGNSSLKDMVRNGKIGIKTAAQIAGFSIDMQETIILQIKNGEPIKDVLEKYSTNKKEIAYIIRWFKKIAEKEQLNEEEKNAFLEINKVMMSFSRRMGEEGIEL